MSSTSDSSGEDPVTYKEWVTTGFDTQEPSQEKWLLLYNWNTVEMASVTSLPPRKKKQNKQNYVYWSFIYLVILLVNYQDKLSFFTTDQI